MNDDEEHGPEMAALNERQRRFVMAMIEYPGITQWQAAELAGYSASSNVLLRKTGHFLTHNPAVQVAIRAEAGKRLNSASLTAANVLMALLTDEAVEAKDRIKAAGMLLDRSGFGAAQTINVNKTTTDRTGKAIMERIAALSQKLGVDSARLLSAGPQEPVVDAEFSEVKDG
jgi:phage terminase small subunit